VNCFIYSVLNFAIFVTIQFVVNVSSSNHYVICVGVISVMRIHYFLSVQCYAWTEYKFTCVCLSVCPSHFLLTRLQVRPLNGFLQLIVQKTRIYARMCLFGVSVMNNHI